jgi:hypothetical protein
MNRKDVSADSTFVTAVTPDDRGVFRLATASGSAYLLELVGGQMFLTRQPATLSPSPDHDAENLRRDTERITVFRLISCVVGVSGRFMLAPLSDNGADTTFRVTTPIVSIERTA